MTNNKAINIINRFNNNKDKNIIILDNDDKFNEKIYNDIDKIIYNKKNNIIEADKIAICCMSQITANNYFENLKLKYPDINILLMDSSIVLYCLIL